jgi:hypothetical protein
VGYLKLDPIMIYPSAIDFLQENIEKINWEWLSSNKNAIHLLEQNQDKIDWMTFLFDESHSQFSFSIFSCKKSLEKNPEKIDWRLLSL